MNNNRKQGEEGEGPWHLNSASYVSGIVLHVLCAVILFDLLSALLTTWVLQL